MSLTNGNTPACLVEDCIEEHHAQGLCGAHYQEWRRTGEWPTVEAKAERHRKQGIKAELTFGFAPAYYSDTRSMFDNGEERRAAWEAVRDELLSEYTAKGGIGHRPWAWWSYEAGRPEHLDPWPFSRDFPDRESYGRACDEYRFEPIIYLAANGHLLDHELEAIRRQAREALPRVGTDRERMTTPAMSPDRSRVRLARAVEEALGGESYGRDHGIPYSKE
jgi:hypothetical protein